ncbi:LysR family transcriptional regulator ArgP [Bordetella holmesii]|uniref:Transcriptional regulator, ArgP family n=2 Tax=Bordetella holmesii TaxID=35814 RepID=A0A158M9K5_9BORD|nr:LysR family transcriptional regulator ArgP [Bordetella holmesii]AHV91483.1 transcriptional regulator, LysR family [Bordetella holmesii ATCC 51541]AIT25870.1 transcriptional regulator, LysR family [Bordetella holmesii 44057]EWM42250.1 transcriptional regulator, LysR family [Bordetella holmesii 41130]EWM46438.1 transcriptional regulator, LysR family [Bordetella holmesii 35009]EWM50603.1 transcriptional regulator, LysR family [Bordetella holmesii 70147]
MKLDHDHLRALAAVVREGSFERAASALHVTASAVSQRIKTLEDRSGRLLIQRTVPARPTPDGQVLVQLAEQTALLEHDALHRLGVAEDEITQASIPVAVNHDSLETWFIDAATRFAARSSATLDMQSEDQDHTAALLRNGTVLGAVTTLAEPVQGCRIHPLGSMRYVATCSPDFLARHFSSGVTARTLAAAPVLVFNRKDGLQARFARRIMRSHPWQPPVWWVPSSRAFVQATLDGLGWTMNPLPLIKDELDSGRLVPLRRRAWEDVPIYWQHWRVNSQAMSVLTDSVLAAARALVRKRQAQAVQPAGSSPV